MTLTDFLLARIAEDEAAARTGMGQQKSFAFPNISGGTSTLTLHHDDPFAPARVLAECEAKRRIVELTSEWCPHGLAAPTAGNPHRRVYPGGWCDDCEQVMRALAMVYSDHPDYDTAWTP